jgi:hypothetical protein
VTDLERLADELRASIAELVDAAKIADADVPSAGRPVPATG